MISCNAKNALSHIKTGSISPKKALNKTPGILPWGVSVRPNADRLVAIAFRFLRQPNKTHCYLSD